MKSDEESVEADTRRDELLRRMLHTPPKPRKKQGREPKPAPLPKDD